MKHKRKIIESGFGYAIYFHDGLYFVDFYRPKCDGYTSLEGAKECVYYAGLRNSKT